MHENRVRRVRWAVAVATSFLLAGSPSSDACTRALYVAKDGTVIVSGSMDWGEDMHSSMWVLPRGMARDGRGGQNTISWVSKYGSLVVSAYDIGTAEGMNERGLVVNELALVESDYGTPPEGAKVISLSTWPQYVLDNFATVAEAVADLRRETFRVQTMVLGTGRAANMHLVISDASGDSAVFEYVQGKLVIHHGKQYRVITNSPTYDKQLAIMEYWKEAGGLSKSLPGTSRAADRFVRVRRSGSSSWPGEEPTRGTRRAGSWTPSRSRSRISPMSHRRGDAHTPVDVEILTYLDRTDLVTTPIDTTLLERDTIVFHRRQGSWIAVHERHSLRPSGG